MNAARELFRRTPMAGTGLARISGRYSTQNVPVGRSLALVLIVSMLGFTPGCGLLRAPSTMVASVVPEGHSSKLDPVDQQMQLQRFADDFLAQAGQALDASAERLGTDSGRVQVMRLKLVCGSSMLSVVSGPNPNVNLLDIVSVTVLARMSVENYWMKTTNGAAFEPWLEASRVLETNVWDLAARFLKPAQVQELRLGIEQWYARTPEVRTAFFARPHAFASMVRTTKEKGAGVSSVFGLVNLDPTAGLDPAVREVTRSRLFAERAMFTMQRMPFLLRLQAELLAHDLVAQPGVQLALSNSTQLSDSAERVSRAAENISQSVAQLPDRLSAERKEILATLDLQGTKLRDLVAGVNGALASGKSMSDSVNVTVTNFNSLMKRFGVGEPTVNQASGTNSPPFNILDYAKTADEIARMANDLNVLVNSVNQTAPEIQRLTRQADADMQKVVDHGFRLCLVLIAVLLIGAVVTGLLYTFLAQKLKQHTTAAPR
ncbi:MAG: hypothetical protein C5B50_19025 [Verrucomicrobia bacterium]|nr:MAG: hypothetical protein C5B50_19025 [Verrucomicrobiota bacterium]